jgi:hypothetical protein
VETRDIIRGEGGTCEAIKADATVFADLEAAVATCRQAFGRVDILHNNVGRGASGGPVEMSEAEWRIGLDLNLTAAFLACKAVLPVMIAQGGGTIVHVGSIVGTQYPGAAAIAYQTAKAGLVQLSRSVALQYARDGRAWDIAYAVLYLASDEAGHITGTELVVDGGASGVCLGSYGPTAVPFSPHGEIVQGLIIQGRAAGKLLDPSLPTRVRLDASPEHQRHPAPWPDAAVKCRGALALRSFVAIAVRWPNSMLAKAGERDMVKL